VAPTILELLDVPAPAVDGVSLVDLAETPSAGKDLPAYCETYYREEMAEIEPAWKHFGPLAAVRTPDRKVVWEVGRPSVEMYDLARDPDERDPIPIVRNRT
jgi:arylsulfatase A-like enzyme